MELFLDTLEKNGRAVPPEEVFELLLQDKHYPIKKLIPKHATNRILRGQVEQLRTKMVKEVLFNDRRIKEALEHHSLFRELCGNPTSIVILASALANPLITRSPTLAELYKAAITDGQDVFEDDKSQRSQDSDSEKGYTPLKLSSNNFSLQFTIETSIKLLQESTPVCIDLFYFLGCLPGGFSMNQLRELWRDPEEPLEMLRKMSFLERGVEKHVLTANLIEYVEMSIKAESKTKLMNQIGEYYIQILEEFFRANSGSKSQHDRETDSQTSVFHFGDMMQ